VGTRTNAGIRARPTKQKAIELPTRNMS